jgi:primosomal protein N' (replication factor Y)
MPKYAEIIIPLAIDRLFTYHIPEALVEQMHPGIRVEVPFGPKKFYTGLVMRTFDDYNQSHRIKDIIAVLDDEPLLSEVQFKFWTWLANYYMCSMGQIMHAALPSELKLTSETTLLKKEGICANHEIHTDEEFLILEALEIQHELTLAQIQQILDKKTILPHVNSLFKRGLINLREELKSRYKPKTIGIIELGPEFAGDEEISSALALVNKYERQVDCLLGFVQLSRTLPYVAKSTLQKKTNVSYSTIKSLVNKGIFQEREVVLSRLGDLELSIDESRMHQMNSFQTKALHEINELHQSLSTVLLHGITGSGKTRLYIELIKEQIKKGKQVLYLLPEIALTAQFITRLQSVFGKGILAYHSKLSQAERVEIFKSCANDVKIIIGARSALLLPFSKLGLIIVDESHDHSYKQQDPAPRYHGRDAAIVLAKLFDAKVLLGTATPSLESIYNCREGKYGYVRLDNRVLDLKPPKIELVSLNQIAPNKMHGPFSQAVMDQIKETIEGGKQALIFRNRRGYAPVLRCTACGWHAECVRCDISLTYHKYSDSLRCHYCGYKEKVISSCPSCGNTKLLLRGTGTEKIEETLKLLMPGVVVDRLDFDTASGQRRLNAIIQKFESGETDILVGTQMITKGLDFENVNLVCVLLADALMYFPDFRAEERAFQILNQVAGRAGRKYENSRVLVQTYQSEHPIFKSLSSGNQDAHYERLMKERQAFVYPPFARFINIQFRHTDYDLSWKASQAICDVLHNKFKLKILGPTPNPVKRINRYYLINCIIKSGKSTKYRHHVYSSIKAALEFMENHDQYKKVKYKINVDPY